MSINHNMRNIVFIILCLPLFASAQTIVTKHSAWQEITGGKFYVVRLVEYSDGTYSQTRNLSGDTATVFNNSLKTAVQEGYRMANVAYEARDNDKSIRAVLKQSDTLLVYTGMDLADTLTAIFSPSLLASGWEITEAGSEWAIEFTVNANGSLRYQIAGYVQRGGNVISNTMRLNNWRDSGKNIDLYKAPGGNWFSIDDAVKIKFPGNQGLND